MIGYVKRLEIAILQNDLIGEPAQNTILQHLKNVRIKLKFYTVMKKGN